MKVYTRMTDGRAGETDVDPGQSISDQLGSNWAMYGYNLPPEKSVRRSIVPLILVAIIAVLGALLIYGAY